MCAINGSTGKDEALVERMNAVTRHRGPDGSRVWSTDEVTLGFNRLAIIDLSPEAMQPMQDSAERYTLVFNGEIYNYRELKKELAEYPFVTESDSEVILAAYSRWGDAAFSKLNGMFALALWDSKEHRLVLARDSVGIKPLYHHFDGTRLVFSSEIEGVFESGVERKLHQEALGHYLRLMYVPGEMTMIDGIKKLLPGHTLVYQNGTISVQDFRGRWPDEPRPQTYADAVTATKNSIDAAVARQLVSDRPVGVYLSGGIDSSAVLSAAVKVHPHINTYSVGFELEAGEEPGKFNADSILAKKTAEHFGAVHHEYVLSSSDALNLFKEVAALGEPIGNATALAQLFLARKVKDTATVVLTGEGGDELFGGYERYRMSLIAEKYGALVPSGLARLIPKLTNVHLSGVDRFAQLMFQKDATLRPLLAVNFVLPDTKKLFADLFGGADIVDELMHADEKNWLVDEALARADITSMAGAIEARVPLLDLEIRALAHALPREYKVTPFATKKVLKDAFRGVLPAEVLSQPKRGWFSPGAKWLRRSEFVAFADEVFSDSYAPQVASLFNMPAVRQAWQDHLSKKTYNYTTLWALLVFLEWARVHKVTL